MTRAERNNKLKHFIACLKCKVSGKNCDVNCPTQYDAGNMGEIIENLEVISKALEQEPCEDAISRQAVIDLVEAEAVNPQDGTQEWRTYVNDTVESIWREVRSLPSVTPQEPKTGHWITLKDEYGDINEAVCSCCDANGYHKWHYCQNCGAKMVEPQESEDKE